MTEIPQHLIERMKTPTEPVFDTSVVSLARDLATATKSGALRWEETDADQAYLATVESGCLVISLASRNPTVSFLDQVGDEVRVAVLEVPIDDYQVISDLHRAIPQSVKDAKRAKGDVVVDAILAEVAALANSSAGFNDAEVAAMHDFEEQVSALIARLEKQCPSLKASVGISWTRNDETAATDV